SRPLSERRKTVNVEDAYRLRCWIKPNMGGPRMKTCLLIAVGLTLLIPSAIQASEEKPISMEAIMEAISALRSLVAEQQRQIEQLHDALNTAAIPTPAADPPEPEPAAGTVMTIQPQVTAAQLEDVSKKVDTVATGLGGFKLSGDFRFRADLQARKGNA